VWHDGSKQVTVGEDGFLRMQGLVCVPNVNELRELILEEAHSSRYFSPGHCQDVSGLAATLLVEEDEEGYSCLCSSVPELSASEV